MIVAFHGAVLKAGKTLNEKGLKAAWKAVDDIKQRQEGPIRREYVRLLEAQRKAVLTRWRNAPITAIPEAKRFTEADRITGSLVFDIGAWLDAIADEFAPLLLDAIRKGFETGALAISEVLEFNLTPRAANELAQSISRIQGTTQYTQDVIGKTIRDGLDRGDSVDTIADALNARFTGWKESRARLVAQTEVTNVFEGAQQDAWLEAGVLRNRWLSMRDDRVRPEHDAMDGEEVAVGEEFSNGLEHPSEPNCRCVLIPVGVTETKTWTQKRNERMREAYAKAKREYPQWEQAVEAVMETEGAGLSFETVRQICHSR